MACLGVVTLASCGVTKLSLVPEYFCPNEKRVRVKWETTGVTEAQFHVTRDGKTSPASDSPNGAHELSIDPGVKTSVRIAAKHCCDHAAEMTKMIEALGRPIDVSVGGGARCIDDTYTQVKEIKTETYSRDLRVLAIANRTARDVTIEKLEGDPQAKPDTRVLFRREVAQGASIDTKEAKATSGEPLSAVGYWRITAKRGDLERCVTRPEMYGMMPRQEPLHDQIAIFPDPREAPFPVLANLQVGCVPPAAAQAVDVPRQPPKKPASSVGSSKARTTRTP